MEIVGGACSDTSVFSYYIQMYATSGNGYSKKVFSWSNDDKGMDISFVWYAQMFW